MGNIFFVGLLLIYIASSFRFTYSYMGVNRVFLGLFGGVVDSAVVPFGTYASEIQPFFDTSILMGNVNRYLEANMANYVADYTVSYSWTYRRINGVRKVIKANITLKTDYLFLSFNKTATFAITQES